MLKLMKRSAEQYFKIFANSGRCSKRAEIAPPPTF